MSVAFHVVKVTEVNMTRDPTNSELLTAFACWVLSLACVLGLTAVFHG